MPSVLISVAEHYDRLIEEENDPFRDPPTLRAYMDGWDGAPFLEAMALTAESDVLEIGVGTGRLAARVAPHCRRFVGIDLSPRTVARARENLAGQGNVTLICGDFLTEALGERFDVVYSSLTFMHIEDTAGAIAKAATLLKKNGRFVLSIDKGREEFLDFGTRRVRLYPDDPQSVCRAIAAAGLVLAATLEAPHAYIFVAKFK